MAESMVIGKADVLLFDVCQSKWTINANYNHSVMLMIFWGSLIAPVVSLKCVLKIVFVSHSNRKN